MQWWLAINNLHNFFVMASFLNFDKTKVAWDQREYFEIRGIKRNKKKESKGIHGVGSKGINFEKF